MRIVLMLSLVILGLGHRPPPALASPASYDLAYQLPDGSFADICADHQSGKSDHGSDHAADRPCEACRIGAQALLPAPADLPGQPIRLDAPRAVPVVEALFVQRPVAPQARPRAPPLSAPIA